jgi:Flp pilus assembly protein TadG
MFAAGTIPMVGLVGLAVDYGNWNQTNSVLAVAANVAALTAVKVAANAQIAADPNAQTEGVAAGQQWFLSEVGAHGKIGTTGLKSTISPVVTLTMGATVTATVSYSGYLPSIFGQLFGVAKYPITGQAAASVATAPYLDVEILIDTSSSMDIGATVQDMQLLNNISACDPNNAVYNYNSATQSPTTGNSYDPYDSYAYSGYGRTYDGTLTTPAIQTGLVQTGVTPTNSLIQNETKSPYLGPECNGVLPVQTTGPAAGHYPLAGPPCAFACHWDATPGHNNGLAQDLYGMARRTLGTAKPITLRMDIVKNATNQVIEAMQADDQSIKNLHVGLFTFNTTVTQVFPAVGSEAGDDWGTAEADVGTPPTTPTMSETGILPTIGYRQGTVPTNNDTNFPEAMTTLTNQYLTKNSGDGTTAAKPRKVLFIITDGFLDDSTNGARSAFDPSDCNQFKSMGYTIYVVYTPYYPVQHIAYLQNDWSAIVTGTGPGSITYNLNACSSSPNGTQDDFIAATDGPSLAAALQSFLKSALNQPARFSM